MRALYKTPESEKFREIVIPPELGVLQELVGGYIETSTFAPDACVVCNEDGLLLGLDYNCRYKGNDYVGPIIIIGVDGENLTDAPMSLLEANKGIERMR